MTTVRLRLDLAYVGTDFAGWARQPGLRTVQGVLEDGLATVLRDDVRLVVAGRTDAGVHARGQVAHLDVDADRLAALRARDGAAGPQVLVRRLAGVLPSDVVVREARVAADGFDARFSALRRTYVYRVRDGAVPPDPWTRGYVLWHRHPLEVDAMDTAARRLEGLHDFAAFCRPRPGATTIRTLETFGWQRAPRGADAGLLVAHVQADAFCHSMVRALVGACLAVGQGSRDVDWPAQLLAEGRRGATVAAAAGLTLEDVEYPPDDDLADRADRTRARRSLPEPGGCCD